MKQIREVLQLSTSFLQERKIENSRRVAEELFASVLQCKRIDLYLRYDQPVEERELALLRELLKRGAKGEPVEYIVGSVEFGGAQIRVDQRALIPRPETEILLAKIVQEWGDREGECWDVCTGSGCIGIALKLALPQLRVTLSDLSKEALALARENAERNRAEVSLMQGDLLAPFSGKADLIVCNPPYVSEREFFTLHPSVREFEPRGALVGGPTGLEFYERLARELPERLAPGGRAYLEMGTGQGEGIEGIFIRGPWAKIERSKDWAGHDRFFFLEMQ